MELKVRIRKFTFETSQKKNFQTYSISFNAHSFPTYLSITTH